LTTLSRGPGRPARDRGSRRRRAPPPAVASTPGAGAPTAWLLLAPSRHSYAPRNASATWKGSEATTLAA
jgi:hypothetical protein